MSAGRGFLRGLAVSTARWVPAAALERVACALLAAKARGLPPAAALRLLLRVDQRLYALEGEHAIRYGEGLHVKHRLTRYHEFFTAHVKPGERVLDIGCGVGAVAYDVAQATGAAVTGIDLDARKIAQAAARFHHPRLTFLVGDALAELPDGTWDVVVLSNLLEHLEDRVGFLRRVEARLHPARTLIRVPMFERDWRVPLKQELGVECRLDPTHQIEHRAEALMEELRQAGLAVTQSLIRWGECWAVCVPASPAAPSDAVACDANRHA